MSYGWRNDNRRLFLLTLQRELFPQQMREHPNRRTEKEEHGALFMDALADNGFVNLLKKSRRGGLR
jgi:hypothetical protein